MKKTFLSLICLFAFALLAKADTGAQSFGITNATLADSAGASALGVSTVSVDSQDNVSLIFKATSISTNVTSTFKFTLARVDANGNVETSPLLTWSPPVGASGTNAVVLWTNLPNAVIGAAKYLSLVNMTNVSGGALSSPYLYVQRKHIKAGR